MVVSIEVFEEYEKRVPEVLAEQAPQANVLGPLLWMRQKALWVESAALGKQRSGDPKDERFLAAALSAKAQAIISYDRHLLDLEKPFGIPVMRPAAFLVWMEQLLRR
jgi:predicted nucleic acid-binding protein